jgi:hypothetical protein
MSKYKKSIKENKDKERKFIILSFCTYRFMRIRVLSSTFPFQKIWPQLHPYHDSPSLPILLSQHYYHT